METFKGILVLIYIVIAWRSINYLQYKMGLSFWATTNGYMQILVIKFFLALGLGWLIIPIVFIHKLVTGNHTT